MTSMRPPNNTTLLKVVILGDGGVGKSCLMNRFVSNYFADNTFHTIGVEFLNKDIECDGARYTLQIWDTAGQERFRALRTPFYRGSDICILCYGVDDRNSFKGLMQWREEFLKYADVSRPDHFPFIIVGNKNDIPSAKRMVTLEEVSLWCHEVNVTSFIETSAKTSEHVNDAFVLAVRQWQSLEKLTERELRAQSGFGSVSGDIIDLTKSVHLPSSSDGRCCISSIVNSDKINQKSNRSEVFE